MGTGPGGSGACKALALAGCRFRGQPNAHRSQSACVVSSDGDQPGSGGTFRLAARMRWRPGKAP